jgi:TP901 family phage tail tape measure protein
MPDVADLRVKVSLDGEQEVAAGLKQADSAVTSFAANAGKAGGAIGSIAKDFAAFGLVAGGAVAAGLGAAIGQATNFEAAMSKVKAASNANTSQMAAMGAAALALGADTQLAGIDASDAATAMAELAKGGVSVADQLGGATKGALLLASAGGIAVADAAGIATKAMNIFGLSGADVAHVADLMSAGANKSATDVGQLGAAFNQSAAVAKSAGLDIETLTGTLAFLAQRGMEGSDAGTSLKTALLALQAPTQTAAKTMDELGINVRDAQGHMLPFADIADVLKDRLAGLSDAQRDAALKTIFGNDAIRVGIALYEGGGSAIRDWTANVNDAGNAARTGATLNDNLKGSLAQLGANFQTAAIQVGEKFLPVIRKGSDELGNFVAALASNKDVAAFFDDLAKKAATALDTIIAKAKDPTFQVEVRQWATTAKELGVALLNLGGTLKDTLGPPLKAAADWFSGLDDQGRKNVVMFGLVAGAAIHFRDELGTLKGVVEDVIGAFARKEAAKKSLTAANEGLAGSAGKTTTALSGTGAAAADAGLALASVAAVTVTAGAAAVGLVEGVSLAADALDQSGQRAKDNAQAWDAASFAIAHGGTEANGAVDAFTRLTISAGVQAGDVGRMSVLWNQYVGSLQAGGQSTDTLGLKMADLTQFVTGATGAGLGMGTAFSAAATALAATGTAATGLGTGLGAATSALGGTANAAVALGTGLGAAASAMGGTQTAALGLGNALGAAASAIGAVSTAAAAATPPLAGAGLAFGAFATAIAGAQGVVTGYDQQIQGLGGEFSHLGGYLGILQGQWDRLNVATDNGKHVTADQAAEYARLAPLIEYLNAQQGVYRDRQVAAAEAGVQAMQALDSVNQAASAGAAHQADYAASLQTSAGASHAAADAATIASIKYNEFGQAVSTLPPAVTVDTSAAQTAATIATIKYDEFGQAVNAVPKAVTTTADASSAVIAAGQMAGLRLAAALVPTSTTTTATANTAAAAVALAGLQGAINLVPRSISITASVDISGALNQIQTLRDNMPHSPAKEGPFRQLPDWTTVFDTFGTGVDGSIAALGRLGAATDSATADLQKKIADAASSVAKAITDTLGALSALSSFDFAKNSPSGATLGWFSFLTTSLVATIVDAASAFKSDALKAAGEFADAAGKVSGFIKTALDAFQALSTYDFAKGSPGGSALGWFRFLVESLVATIAEAADGFDTVALKAASDFADAAGKVAGFVKAALDAFAGLSKYAPPAVANIYAFGKTLRSMMNDFALVAEQVTQQAADDAAKFAVKAGSVVEMVGKGVDAFTKLVTFLPPPVAAIYAFGKTLRATLNDFALLAEQVTQEATNQAAAFAEGAGKVVGMIGSGVEAFTKLGDYEAPAASAIYAFGKTLRAVINDFSLLAEQITQEATDQAAKFATGAGQVVGIIGNAVDGLSKLADFVAPSQTAIDNFVYAVYETVRKIGEMASQMSKDGIAQAGLFGTAAGSVLGALKTALDVFTGLAKLVVPSAQAIDNFGIAVAYTVRRLGEMADQIGKDGLKAAADFGTKVGTIFGALKSAMDILTSLQKFPDLAKKAMDAFLLGIQQVVQRMTASTDQAGEFAKQAAGYKAQILAGVADVKEAQQALNTIGSIGGTPDLHKVGQGVGTSIVEGARDTLEAHSPSEVMASIGRDVVAGLVQGMDGAQQDAAKKAADVASAIAQAISAGVAAFGSLSRFVAPDAGPIAAFGETLRLAVDDLAVLSEQVGAAMLAAAATFAEGAGKAVGLYSSGVSAFAGLRDYVRPAAAAIYDFGKDLRLALNDLALLAEQLTTDTSDLAGRFGEGVAKATGGIVNAVAGFVALRDYARVPAAALYDFGKDLRLLVQDFAAIVDIIGVDMVEQAGRLGDSVGKITGGIAGAVAGFAALRDFARVPAAAIDAFAASLDQLLARLATVAAHFQGPGLDATTALGEALGKITGGIGTAVSGLTSLLTFISPPASAMDAFAASVHDIIARMVTVAATLATDGVAAAAALGEGFSKVFAGLNAGTSFFKSLDNILLPDQAGIDRILAPMLAVVSTLANAARQFDPATLATTGALADLLSKVFAAVQAGNQARAPVATGGGGGGGGNTYVYEFNISGNIYGFDKFEDEVVGALEDARRRGRIT